MKKILVIMSPEQKEQSIKAIAELLLPKNKSNLKEGKLFAACFSMSNLLSAINPVNPRPIGRGYEGRNRRLQ